MLTRLLVRNFKRFDEADIDLGKTVVFIGPNNSGKTTALQALALWDIGLRRWIEKRQGRTSPEKRPGVTINRRDLISVPTPDANLLWRNLQVRNVEKAANGKPNTQNIRVDIVVEGVSNDKAWKCGLEFDYANQESFYCRPLRLDEGKQPERMAVPSDAADVRIAYLPPMSGLAAQEPRWEPGRINVLIGEGRTAQILRNLCYRIHEKDDGGADWSKLQRHIQILFGVELDPPDYLVERGEITMTYREPGGVRLDISSGGRGLQQTTLLIAHLYANPSTVLLLDEPDAHLEILRQRQIYQLLTQTAEELGSQIIAASHSEIVLNEAAERDVVVAFVGSPHRIDDRGSQVLKSLRQIGFDQYYQAEQTGWVLYLEGPTDLAILRAFAETLDHPAAACLEQPFVKYVGNVVGHAADHFHGLKEAKPDLVGVGVFDRLDRDSPDYVGVQVLQWRRREIENYLCFPEVLTEFARSDQPNDLFGRAEAARRKEVMERAVENVSNALKTLDKEPWSAGIKASDEFLDPLFKRYFEALGLPMLLRKSAYDQLAKLVPARLMDPEVAEKLDAIVEVASQARPRTN